MYYPSLLSGADCSTLADYFANVFTDHDCADIFADIVTDIFADIVTDIRCTYYFADNVVADYVSDRNICGRTVSTADQRWERSIG